MSKMDLLCGLWLSLPCRSAPMASWRPTIASTQTTTLTKSTTRWYSTPTTSSAWSWSSGSSCTRLASCGCTCDQQRRGPRGPLHTALKVTGRLNLGAGDLARFYFWQIGQREVFFPLKACFLRFLFGEGLAVYGVIIVLVFLSSLRVKIKIWRETTLWLIAWTEPCSDVPLQSVSVCLETQRKAPFQRKGSFVLEI